MAPTIINSIRMGYGFSRQPADARVLDHALKTSLEVPGIAPPVRAMMLRMQKEGWPAVYKGAEDDYLRQRHRVAASMSIPLNGPILGHAERLRTAANDQVAEHRIGQEEQETMRKGYIAQIESLKVERDEKVCEAGEKFTAELRNNQRCFDDMMAHRDEEIHRLRVVIRGLGGETGEKIAGYE